MTPHRSSDHWLRVEDLLAAVLEREPAERDVFLRESAAGDEQLYDEVVSLLAAHERTGMVDRLAGDLGPVVGRLREGASLAGRTAGRYRVLERIGGGGMGVVHRAMDDRLGRAVALKFLRSRLDADESAAERFRLEARSIAALEHPNICTVHEIGETDDGRLYLAMPLYEGETLQAIIARGPLPVADAVAIAVQICRALGKAHARGIIHRDIKPSNVFLTADGVVKLLDFGIVKLAGIALTGNAGPLGTPSYMSPEQARAGPLDHRTDLWSLGVVLYEMLTARRPFEAGVGVAVIAAVHRHDPVPLTAYREGIPPELQRLVATALAKAPERRYQTAQDLEADLLALGLTPIASGAFPPVPLASTSAMQPSTPVLSPSAPSAQPLPLAAAAPANLRPSSARPMRWLAMLAIALLALLLMAALRPLFA